MTRRGAVYYRKTVKGIGILFCAILVTAISLLATFVLRVRDFSFDGWGPVLLPIIGFELLLWLFGVLAITEGKKELNENHEKNVRVGFVLLLVALIFSAAGLFMSTPIFYMQRMSMEQQHLRMIYENIFAIPFSFFFALALIFFIKEILPQKERMVVYTLAVAYVIISIIQLATVISWSPTNVPVLPDSYAIEISDRLVWFWPFDVAVLLGYSLMYLRAKGELERQSRKAWKLATQHWDRMRGTTAPPPQPPI